MKFLKWLAVIFILIILILIVTPFIFKGKIVDLAKQEINKNLNAKVEFGDFSLRIFSSFPDLTFKIEDFKVIGKDEFEKDTLAQFYALKLNIDLMSVFGDEITVNSIILDRPSIVAKSLKGGKVNWDVTFPSEAVQQTSTDPEVPSEESSFKLGLKHFEIIDGTLIYDDQDLDVLTILNGINMDLSGDMTADQTILNTNLTADNMTLVFDGVKYFNKTQLKVSAGIDADLANYKYTLRENQIFLNELELGLDGYVSMPADDIDMDFTFGAKRNEFKHFLSLVPAIFMKDFESVQTSGNLALKGGVKGKYNETSMPGYFVQLKVDNGMFKYPDLPGSAERIAIDLNVNNPDGIDDHMVIDLKKFHIDFEKNPVDASMQIKTPMSDPDIKGHVKANLDLDKLKNVIPLEDVSLNGQVFADLKFDGKMSSIEQEKYNDFKAVGNVLIQEMNYESADLPKGMNISRAELKFTPQYLKLQAFESKIGESDIQMKGNIDNYMAYAIKDDVLRGDFTLNSTLLNINELMPADEETATNETEEGEIATENGLSVFEVPANIDFKLQSKIGKVIYDNLEIENLNGLILVKDSKVSMEEVQMNMLDGSITMNGGYDTKDITKPVIDFDFGINNFNISKTFEAFNTIKQMIPIAEKCSGDFSAAISNYSCVLDHNMMPVLSSISSNGKLMTQQVLLKNADVFSEIGSQLKMDKFKQLDLNNIDLSFEIKDGNIFVKPFDVKMGSSKATIGGKQGIDQTLDYTMVFEIPRSQFGGAANQALDNLLSSAKTKGVDVKLGDKVNVNALIGGTITKPIVKLDLKEQGQNIVEDIKQEVVNTVNEELDKAKEKAIKEAKAKAANLLTEADKKGKQLITAAQKTAGEIEKAAKTNADKIRAEAKKQGDKLIKDAGSNIIKKKIAEKGAQELNKQAEKKAKKLEDEAAKKADAGVAKAKAEAQKLKKKAEDEGDRLIEKAGRG